MRVVVDHLAGARRGQRQELPADARVRFGRHPDCEVAFDAHRDIDASSRHAELRVGATDAGWVLVDIGSSNGTYVDGKRVTEAPVAAAQPLVVEFGPGGPRIRLFVGDDAAIGALPPVDVAPRQRPWMLPAIGVGVLALVLLVLAVRC
jgi:pSer/pThr/pTyr-binding forkhead associated (FHA) protein|nr:FHA domain-containing protein [Kofleriaceae bacterium]